MRRDRRRARRRTRQVAFLGVGVAVVAVCSLVLLLSGTPAVNEGVRAAAADGPVLATSPTLPASTTSTTEAPIVLPTPTPSPADVYAKVPVVAIGQISIPKIGLTHTIYEGVWLTVVDNGPGHWPGTAMPGERGNSVFAGHRVTHSHPFRNVDQLEPGDDIILQTDKGTFTYDVTGTEIVPPTALWIVDQTPEYTLTLFACHPPGSAAYRIVVHGKLVSPTAA